MENPGCVCVYNWVEWLRENVHPTPLDVSSAHEVKEEPKEEAEEVVEKNIIFVTVVILLIVAAATVLVVATIDYGDDYAGLYSKYKQEKSQ